VVNTAYITLAMLTNEELSDNHSNHSLEGAPEWQTNIAKKKAKREALVMSWGLSIPDNGISTSKTVKHFPVTSGLLTSQEIAITDSTPTVILKNIEERTWTAEDIFRAFANRAVIAHFLTNPLTEVFFEQGLEQAKKLDEIQRTTNRLVGPLHGLPISLKDVLHVKGQESTTGYAAWIGNTQTEDDVLVAALRDAGAIFYCKTNVPQTLMSGECVNFVFGRTSSPWNTALSAGGSSGGEGSLVSLGGSALGIGSDIAGSIRTPANFNGVYGLCPSPGRFPAHRSDKMSGDMLIVPVCGPISRSLDGLEVCTKAILSMNPWERDHSVLRMPWREEEYLTGMGSHRSLCFAVMRHDGVVLPNPPIQRCLAELCNKIEAAGHQVIELEPFDGEELERVLMGVLGATGSKDIWETLKRSGEPLIKEVELSNIENAISAWEYKRLAVQLGVIRQKYLDIVYSTASKTTSGLPVDGIILPSGGTVAPPHGTMEYYTYEAISNVLNWTCATIPVGFVDPTRDRKLSSFSPMSEYDRRNYEKCNAFPISMSLIMPLTSNR
jgi:amidase